jgi:hypothetical protein
VAHGRERQSWSGRAVEGVAPVSSVEGRKVFLRMATARRLLLIKTTARDADAAAGLVGGQVVRFRGTLDGRHAEGVSFVVEDCTFAAPK